MTDYHIPVLLQETTRYLNVTKDSWYIDATLGGGGHTFEILKRGGRVLGIDQDQDALEFVKERLKREHLHGENLQMVRGNFRDIDQIAHSNGIEEVAGILFDLGVSSHQLDTGERGFSFQKDAILDMRMDRSLSVTAKDLVNGLGRNELADLFFKLGDEPKSRLIANKIVEKRKEKEISTTKELTDIILSVSRSFDKVHPATKVFQALRIAVNDELHSVEDALPKALTLLRKNGRLVVITFHSLEDRIVKNTFQEFANSGKGTILTEKPEIATEAEITQNPRARSAKIRVFEKN